MIFIPDTSSINYLILTDANDSGPVIYQTSDSSPPQINRRDLSSASARSHSS